MIRVMGSPQSIAKAHVAVEGDGRLGSRVSADMNKVGTRCHCHSDFTVYAELRAGRFSAESSICISQSMGRSTVVPVFKIYVVFYSLSLLLIICNSV